MTETNTVISVVVGLGNPGRKYEGTRHNAGFELIDRYACSKAGGARWVNKFGAETIELNIGPNLCPIWLLKPQGYMNLSGGPVGEFVRFFKIPVNQVLVAHDEVDIPVGAIRLKQGGGDGGHNGLASITSTLGSGEYYRLRLGVGRPEVADYDLADWVLGRFTAEERKIFDSSLELGLEAITVLMEQGLKEAQNRFHKS